jgi:putative photosynthetic complex assembly protein 2
VDYALPVAFAIVAWWTSTIVLIYRVRLPGRTYPVTMAFATLAALAGLYAIAVSRGDTSAFGPYVGFLGGLALWGWLETAYLLGFVSGSRPEACPADVRGWQRFVRGVKASIYHELAVVATAAVLAALTWNADNRIGLWTFVVLWVMRWSAKLNIFLGVRNLHTEFWPEHLEYLESFTRVRSMNSFFPWSVAAAVLALFGLGWAAATAGDDTLARGGAMLLATLMALAILEHCLLMLEVRDDLLWRPATRSRRDSGAPAG